MLNQVFGIDLISPAQLLGYGATVVGIAAFSFKNDLRFKASMAISLMLWAVQYGMLGSWTSAATSILIASRQALSMLAPGMSHRGKLVMSGFYMVAFTVILYLTWDGLISILPYAAAMNATWAFVFLQGERMRKQVMFSTLAWLINARLIGSVGHMVTTTVTLAINGWTIWRLSRERKAESAVFTEPLLVSSGFR